MSLLLLILVLYDVCSSYLLYCDRSVLHCVCLSLGLIKFWLILLHNRRKKSTSDNSVGLIGHLRLCQHPGYTYIASDIKMVEKTSCETSANVRKSMAVMPYISCIFLLLVDGKGQAESLWIIIKTPQKLPCLHDILRNQREGQPEPEFLGFH
jgi:hypothetical protein